MKLQIRRNQQGSILVISVIMSALIGGVLGSYLLLIGNRNQSTMRALAWNSAIPVLEAGIEEALAHLHDDKARPTDNDWTEDTVNGRKCHWKHRQMDDGSYFYVTNFNSSSTTPVIFSAGYVRAPLKANEYVSRLVRVTTTNPPSLFHMAIAAYGAIQLSGSAVVDGYDSAAGRYSPTNRNANGNIGTDSQQPNAIDIGSAHVYGHVVTGPGGTVAVAGGYIGDFDQSQPSWRNDDMNVQFQDNVPPTGQFMVPTKIQVGPSNITVLGSGNYQLDAFATSSMNRPMIVTGNATLLVTGDFSVNGTGYVKIEQGASLKLYVGGKGSIHGGGVVNGSGDPNNFGYYGLPTSTQLTYSGAADFVGIINAPQADVAISGGSSVYGAVICRTFSSSGGSGVHYDQKLGGGGIFLITSWREIRDLH